MLVSNNSFMMFPRRVSFDLSHNVVYLLPSDEECAHAAKDRRREEWQRKSLNEDMLSEDIIAEIQEEYSSGSDEESDTKLPIKSCLKKPPVQANTTQNAKKRKNKNQQKKRKRT